MVVETNVTNPTVANPTVANTNVANPTVANPNVANPTVANPNVDNPNVANPTVANPTVANPNVDNPTVANPNVVITNVFENDQETDTLTNDILSHGKKILYNQDTKQYIKSTFIFLIEMYRVLMGSFLILFIPQDCEGKICTFHENLTSTQSLKHITLYISLITFLSLFVTYIIEYYRELSLIKYLEVNNFKPNDNESIGTALETLPEQKKYKLWRLDNWYKNATYVALSFFCINTILSCIAIFSNFLDSKTITVLVTNFLFIIFKIIDIFTTVTTTKNIFYSAYLKKKVQFNDVDPDYYTDHNLETQTLVNK